MTPKLKILALLIAVAKHLIYVKWYSKVRVNEVNYVFIGKMIF